MSQPIRHIAPSRSLASSCLAAGLLAACLAAVTGAEEPDEKWKPLFDGKSTQGWQVVDKIDFARAGKVHVDQERLILEQGSPATGVRWEGEFPRNNYQLKLEAQRAAGYDFFCGLTFPVEKGSLTLILGGWGGWVVGLSCIDGQYAIENETCQSIEFKNEQWYQVRVEVAEGKVKVWVDDKEIIDLNTADRKLAVSLEMEPCLPLGIATWNTKGAIRKIAFREIDK